MLKRIVFVLLLISMNYAFLHVSGNQIVGPDGREVKLKGYALENGIFSRWNEKSKRLETINDSASIKWTMTEADVQDLKSQGATAVRYCLNIEQFAKDNPLRENNFQLFSERLAWFEKYQIYLIVNLHIYPGFASMGFRPDDQTIFENKKYWQEYEDFWQEFITRYKDRQSIAGWEFINEPYLPLPEVMTEEQWYKNFDRFMQRMRKLDPQHLFFMCNPFARTTKILPNGKRQADITAIPFKYKYTDPNTVYVFHFYEPGSFTHQRYTEDLSGGVNYPLNEGYEYKQYVQGTGGSTLVEKRADGWQKVSVQNMKSPSGVDYGVPSLSGVKGKGKVCYADLRIYEHTPDGKRRELNLPNPGFVPNIPDYLKNKTKDMYVGADYLGWTTYYSDKYTPDASPAQKPVFKLEDSGGVSTSYCLSIDNPYQEIANWNIDPKVFYIKPSSGSVYEISYWVKPEQPDGYYAEIGWYQGTKVKYDRAYLKNIIEKNYLDFARKYDVPVYVSEFGSFAFANLPSRERWTTDILAVFQELDFNYAYWIYNNKYGWGYDCGVIIKDPFKPDLEMFRFKPLIEILSRDFRKK